MILMIDSNIILFSICMLFKLLSMPDRSKSFFLPSMIPWRLYLVGEATIDIKMCTTTLVDTFPFRLLENRLFRNSGALCYSSRWCCDNGDIWPSCKWETLLLSRTLGLLCSAGKTQAQGCMEPNVPDIIGCTIEYMLIYWRFLLTKVVHDSCSTNLFYLWYVKILVGIENKRWLEDSSAVTPGASREIIFKSAI